MNPKVSVVTAVYNFEDIVLETIHSILQQSFTDFELIVVDDGSTDRSADLVEAIDDERLTVIRASHVGLPAAGLNRAYQHSRGDLVAVTGADDVWLPHKLQQQVEFFETNRSVGMVHTGYHHLLGSDLVELPVRHHEQTLVPAAAMLPRMIVSNFICTPTVMLRREAIERAGHLFDVDPLLCGPEDFDLWLRLCEQGVEFGYIHEPLVHYRIRATSVSRNLIRNWRGNLRAFEKAKLRAPERYAKHEKLVRHRLATIYRNLGRMKLIEGQPGGLGDAWHAVTLAPTSLKAWGWTVLGLGGPRFVRSIMSLRGDAGQTLSQQSA